MREQRHTPPLFRVQKPLAVIRSDGKATKGKKLSENGLVDRRAHFFLDSIECAAPCYSPVAQTQRLRRILR